MKIQRILENALPIYKGNVRSYKEWIEIRDSGKWDPTRIGGYFYWSNDRRSKFIDAPEFVGGNFYCLNVGLKTLEGAPKYIGGTAYCKNNELTSLKNIHKQIKVIGRTFSLIENPITSNILGLLLIGELKHVNGDSGAFAIVDNHLTGNKDVLECQEELISAGYKEYAKL